MAKGAARDAVTEMRAEVTSAGGEWGEDVLRKLSLLLKRNAGKGFSVSCNTWILLREYMMLGGAAVIS